MNVYITLRKRERNYVLWEKEKFDNQQKKNIRKSQRVFQELFDEFGIYVFYLKKSHEIYLNSY